MAALPVQVQSVRRRFGSRAALDGVSLEVQPGQIVALAGANGSGKTTLLKILAGFFAPHQGTVRVFGMDPVLHARDVAQRGRFSFAPPALFDELTAAEHMRELGSLVGAADAAECARALELVDLSSRANDRVGTYSFGMRQRLALALCLAPRPELLILDEPTDGLDPLGVLQLRGILEELRAEHGLTILIAQHHFREIQSIVDKVVVLDEGRVILEGSPAELCEAQSRLELRAPDLEVLARALAEHGHAPTRDDEFVLLEPGSLTLARALELSQRAGQPLTSFAHVRPSFEEVLVARLRETRVESGPVSNPPH